MKAQLGTCQLNIYDSLWHVQEKRVESRAIMLPDEMQSSRARTYGGHRGDDKTPAAAGLRVHRAQLGVLPYDAGVLLV